MCMKHTSKRQPAAETLSRFSFSSRKFPFVNLILFANWTNIVLVSPKKSFYFIYLYWTSLLRICSFLFHSVHIGYWHTLSMKQWIWSMSVCRMCRKICGKYLPQNQIAIFFTTVIPHQEIGKLLFNTYKLLEIHLKCVNILD